MSLIVYDNKRRIYGVYSLFEDILYEFRKEIKTFVRKYEVHTIKDKHNLELEVYQDEYRFKEFENNKLCEDILHVGNPIFYMGVENVNNLDKSEINSENCNYYYLINKDNVWIKFYSV